MICDQDLVPGNILFWVNDFTQKFLILNAEYRNVASPQDDKKFFVMRVYVWCFRHQKLDSRYIWRERYDLWEVIKG